MRGVVLLRPDVGRMPRRRLIELRHTRPLQFRAYARLLGIDRVAPFRRVLLVDQLSDGNVGEVRVAEKYRAVKECAAVGLGNQVNVLGGVALGGAQIETLQDVQRLDQRDASGGWRRRTINVISAIASMHGDALDNLIIGKIGDGDQPAARGDRGGNPGGQWPAIKFLGIAGDALQSTRQLRLLQDLARLIKPAVALEDAVGLRIARQTWVVHHPGLVLGDRDSFAGQPDRRIHHLGQAQFAPAALGIGQTGNRPGHTGRAIAKPARIADIALIIQVHIARGGGGSLLAKIEEVHLAFGAAVEHESAAPQIAGRRMHDGERKAGGHRGIDRIAALSHDLGAYAGCLRMRAGHHRVTGANRLKDG